MTVDPTDVQIILKYRALRRMGWDRLVWNECGRWFLSCECEPGQYPSWDRKYELKAADLLKKLQEAEVRKPPAIAINCRGDAVAELAQYG